MGLSRTIMAEHAVVASEQPLASLAGYDVLRKGGNAFDAAVATSFALAVTFHPAGGIGGDFFGMFYHAKTGKVLCLNASGWSPTGLTLDRVKEGAGGQVPLAGPLTCVIPGYVAGICEMHRKLGSLEFADLPGASVEYATRGFPAGVGVCSSVAGAYKDLSTEAKAIFAPNGKPTNPGDWIRQEALGRVIGDVAGGGPDAFYSGWPSEKIAAALTTLGVPCETSDFSDYKPEWVQPLNLDYRGTIVYEVPPNSMGATSLLILKLLLENDLSRTGPLSRERIELTMSAALEAYARRDEMLGDPRFGKIDIESFMSGAKSAVPPQSRIRSGDTTAFSVADSEGNIVSGIQSLFNRFGSRVFVPECGIMLNNRASGFSTAGPNMVEPRKRPLHTLSSLILERDARPYLAIGASGGDYRSFQHALFVTNSVDYSMAAEQNVAHPRFLWGGDRTLLVEDGYELPQSGYEIQKLPMPGRTGVCQAVELSKGFLTGVCDVRGDGIPAGY
ncbi:MAG TPA: gamma-glutamyltransferase family protein [Nitrososphaerales archaeon]|nr:gamma-glutamyltransferase family protein [Nitrososphaerales archaeon]